MRETLLSDPQALGDLVLSELSSPPPSRTRRTGRGSSSVGENPEPAARREPAFG